MKRNKSEQTTTNEQAGTAIEKHQQPATVNVPDRIPQQMGYYTPLVDVAESNAAFLFQADLPGVKAGDVDISFENGTLTIDAKVQPRQPANHSYAWREYGVGHFYRSFSINTPVNADGIKAELRNGVLELYVPKAESARPKRIKVNADNE